MTARKRRASDPAQERKEEFTTGSGRPVKRLYAPPDLLRLDPVRDLGFPGEPPYVRGIQPTMYRGRLWTMRQYAGFGTAEETNKRYHFLLKHGTTGLSVAFDLPTQIGLDPDDPLARGEVGRVGVAVSSLRDMQALFAGIPLDQISTSMTINAPAAVLWADYIAVAQGQGVASTSLEGTIQNDILKEYIARGTYIFPPEASMRLVTNTFEYGAKHVPRWNTISVSGYHIREAGSTAVQELAFTIADGIEYVKAALAAGLKIDEFAPRISFFFNAHNDLFEEVAKFRAARRLWHSIMKDQFQAKDPRSWMLRFHTQTGGSTLAAQSPENNLARVAIQALAATLGGTQSLHTNSFDEALGLPTEKAARLALRTQQVLAHETGVANTVDPFGGSYFLEALTDEIQSEAQEYLRRIDAMGGMLVAIERGWVQHEIHEAAYRAQKDLESKRRIVVGVNEYVDEARPSDQALRIDAKLETVQAKKVRRIRKQRDSQQWESALRELEKTAEGTGNLMPPILEATKANATTGEICGTLRKVFGEYRPPTTV